MIPINSCSARAIFAATVLLSLWGCGMPSIPDSHSLIDRQPMVISISPEDAMLVGADARIKLEFSQSLNPASVSTGTLAIIESSDEMDLGEVVDDLIDGDLTGVEGEYVFDGEGRSVTFTASSDYRAGSEYVVVATRAILSEEMLPLNQNPGMTSTPFISAFEVGAIGEDGKPVPAIGSVGGGNTVERDRPELLKINELLYDIPGSDTDGDVFIELHGSASGDITGYQIVLINGPDGLIKDLITLPDDAILGEDGIYLIADARTGRKGETNVPGADFIDNFDPQNGPDCVQLLDAKGALLDSLGYGEPLVSVAENGLPCFEAMPSMKTISGQSLSRVEGLDTDNNFIDFTFLDIPSPGLLW